MGKSAQFPLHVWLPDSMEGPTPISALIHAATMVTAGIFMVARMSPLFELSDTALSVILVIGAITALFMGFLGIIQTDIKRVVAYSTLSHARLHDVDARCFGLLVAVFHLMSTRSSRPCCSLAPVRSSSACTMIRTCANMGGLRKYMPITWINVAGRFAGADRYAVLLRFLLEGQHHRSGCGNASGRCRFAYFRGAGRRIRHCVLLVPHVFHGVPRRRTFRQGACS